jgi:hypothetical protein
LIPELETNYIEKGKIINISDKNSYDTGGAIKIFTYGIGGL